MLGMEERVCKMVVDYSLWELEFGDKWTEVVVIEMRLCGESALVDGS